MTVQHLQHLSLQHFLDLILLVPLLFLLVALCTFNLPPIATLSTVVLLSNGEVIFFIHKMFCSGTNCYLIVYKPGEAVQCSGNTTSFGRTSGTIVDHFGILGASNYTNDVNCGWLIDVSSVSAKSRVLLTFSLFDLADSDSLTIYDGIIIFSNHL